MNKFDELLALNSKLDSVLDDMKKVNNHLENELKAKRDTEQKKMFDDVDVLRRYMIAIGMRNNQLVLNTGIKSPFENKVFSLDVSTNTTAVGLGVIDVNNCKNRYFYRWFSKNEPIAELDPRWIDTNTIEYMFTIMKNWNSAYANMKDDLFDKIKDFMETKASEVVKKQSELITALEAFDERGN